MVAPEQAIAGVVAVALVAVGAYLVYQALGILQTGWTIWQSDPVDAAAVRHENGTVEVQGNVKQLETELLTTKYTETPAVAHEYKRQEKQHNSPNDDVGTEWKTVDSGTVTQPFYVTDETGSVAVDPEGATVSLDAEKISGGSTIELGPVEGSTAKLYEGSLTPGDHVHVYGQKRDGRGGGPGDEQFYIGDGEQADSFSISDTTEFRTAVRYLGKGLVWLLLGLAAFAGSAVLALALLGQIEITGIGSAFVSLLARPQLSGAPTLGREPM